MPEVVAVIPVREGSQRVKNKNFRPFASCPNLLTLKIRQLKDEGCFEHIYVSSNSEKARRIADENGIEFLYREPKWCSSDIKWSPVIYHVVSTVPGKPIVAWVHSTSPLQSKYRDAVDTFFGNRDEYDSLLTVLPVQEFLVKGNGRPLNYSWGHWHDYSQDLDPLYKVTGALFIAEKRDILEWHYLIGVRPYLYKVSRFESLDVDEEDDFELAETLYRLKYEMPSKVAT